jgi:hypothetical protein
VMASRREIEAKAQAWFWSSPRFGTLICF